MMEIKPIELLKDRKDQYYSSLLYHILRNISEATRDINYFHTSNRWLTKRINDAAGEITFSFLEEIPTEFTAGRFITAVTDSLSVHLVSHCVEKNITEDRAMKREILMYLTEQYLYYSEIAHPLTHRYGEI